MSLTSSGSGAPIPLVGFDTTGEVFLSQGRVLRGIYQGNGALVRQVLAACEAHDLFRLGIVATRALEASPHPELPYELVLEHHRIPFISYPHEWPTSMLQAAALFHIDLYSRLAPYGLTIKDWHPYNVLFEDTEPVLVDFTSIIPKERLADEKYLKPAHVPPPLRRLWNINSVCFYEMYRRTFVPYFLLPLYMLRQRNYRAARARMLQTALNASPTALGKAEVLGWFSLARAMYEFQATRKKLALLDPAPHKPGFLKLLRAEVAGLRVSARRSGYTGYYRQKKEDFDFQPSAAWTNKQRVAYDALRRYRPATVLDVAGNTGWFAVLAAKQGCRVLAFDNDEACADLLYHRARSEKLPILSLVADFTSLTPDVPPLAYENEPRRSLLGGDAPLLLSAEKRWGCDLVLALAILHHLALGEGREFAWIVPRLSALARKNLLLEFVPGDDRLIVSEPGFFPALKARPGGFGWYTEENLVRELKRHFQRVESHESSPASRKILICSR